MSAGKRALLFQRHTEIRPHRLPKRRKERYVADSKLGVEVPSLHSFEQLLLQPPASQFFFLKKMQDKEETAINYLTQKGRAKLLEEFFSYFWGLSASSTDTELSRSC